MTDNHNSIALAAASPIKQAVMRMAPPKINHAWTPSQIRWVYIIAFINENEIFMSFDYFCIMHSNDQNAKTIKIIKTALSLGPHLLTWFNFNPSMDK